MVVLIDNYDSFSHNLARYMSELGLEVEVYRNDQVSIETLESIGMEALVISPGPCTPNESGISLTAIEHFAGRVPILGVCLGHQAIAQVFGARVIKAARVMHGKTSLVSHRQQGLFSQLQQPLEVTRYHSLIVDKASLSRDFMIDAWVNSDEFGCEIMALRHKRMPLYGVQFHPESVMTQQGHQLLKNFFVENNIGEANLDV